MQTCLAVVKQQLGAARSSTDGSGRHECQILATAHISAWQAEQGSVQAGCSKDNLLLRGVGQNRIYIYTSYMTVYLVISLPKITYVLGRPLCSILSPLCSWKACSNERNECTQTRTYLVDA